MECISDIDVEHFLTEYSIITNQDCKKASFAHFDLDKTGELISDKTSKLAAQVLGHRFKGQIKMNVYMR